MDRWLHSYCGIEHWHNDDDDDDNDDDDDDDNDNNNNNNNGQMATLILRHRTLAQ